MKSATTEAPRTAELLTNEDAPILGWPRARDCLSGTRFYWLATTRADGTPHVRPVLAAWLDGMLYVTSSPTAAKGRNLERDGRCSVTARADRLDLVLEGNASPVEDASVLERVAAAYRDKYGWPEEPVPDAFASTPYGPPTAGPPPYTVYAIEPEVVYGFGTDASLGPRSTRWRF